MDKKITWNRLVKLGTVKGIMPSTKRWDLRGANLSGAELTYADLSEAILSGATLFKANLSGATLFKAELSYANFSEANLSGANLSGAILSRAILSRADFSKADLSKADLSKADLRGANLSEAYLSKADLRGAKLKGIDLSVVVLHKIKLFEEDLNGVKYHPEQLKDMIIERVDAREEPLIISSQKLSVSIQFKKERPPLLHLIYLAYFIEKYYDALYIFMFSQYETVNELQEDLSGSLIHRLKDKENAIKIRSMTTKSPPSLTLDGNLAVWILIVVFLRSVPKEIIIDVYKRVMDFLFKTKTDKTKEKIVTAELMNQNANILKKARDLGVSPVDLLTPDEKEDRLPVALSQKQQSGFGDLIEENKESLSSRIPRRDCLMTILLLRKEGLLTNKLDDVLLANLLEIILEKLNLEYKSLYDETGGFDI